MSIKYKCNIQEIRKELNLKDKNEEETSDELIYAKIMYYKSNLYTAIVTSILLVAIGTFGEFIREYEGSIICLSVFIVAILLILYIKIIDYVSRYKITQLIIEDKIGKDKK